MEGLYKIAGNELTSLSEQQLVDCSHEEWHGEYNQGCNGGWMVAAYKYFMSDKNKSESYNDYQYTAETGTDCLHTADKGLFYLGGYQEVK